MTYEASTMFIRLLKFAVRLYKTSVSVNATYKYGTASKQTSLFNCAAPTVLNVASFILLTAISSSLPL